jgi:succinate dehydrogenase / fumarate reductase iron-sulfur subunit
MSGIIRKIHMLRTKKHAEKSKIMLGNNRVNLRIYRSGKEGSQGNLDTFDIPVQRWTTVLDALLYAKAYKDSSIGIRYSCRMASCGSCGMKINGKPRLACYTNVMELDSSEITCEPMSNFPILRDLVTDFTQFFKHHKNVQPYLINPKVNLHENTQLSEFLQNPREADSYLQFSYCIKCGLCYSACPTVATDTKFPGPQALAQAYRYSADTRDSGSRYSLSTVDNKHGVWRCHFSGSCSKVCPKGVDPALGIQLLKGHMMSFAKRNKTIAELKQYDRSNPQN